MPPLIRLAIITMLHLGLWIMGAASLPDLVLGILSAS
jgi:hypothetical protein